MICTLWILFNLKTAFETFPPDILTWNCKEGEPGQGVRIQKIKYQKQKYPTLGFSPLLYYIAQAHLRLCFKQPKTMKQNHYDIFYKCV